MQRVKYDAKLSARIPKDLKEKILKLSIKKDISEGAVVRKLLKQILELPIKPNFSKKTREENL